MTFIDFFAGIGGFRLGMEQAGHKCKGFVEIDKYAVKSYKAMHNTEGEFYANDVRNVRPEDLPEADCYCGGFPCQAFSIAGKRGGFEDMRGTLVFEIFRLAKVRRPEILFLENVAGLLNHDNGRTFGTIISAMAELGYDAEWQCINSKNYGIPQSRERVYIIGHLRGTGAGQIFPIKQITTGFIKGFQGDVSGKGYASQQDRVSQYNGIVPCIPHARTESKVKVLLKGGRIRKMTPKEVWRCQGFSDELFLKAQAVNCETRLYEQAGNSVTVNVIYEIAKRLEVSP